MGKKAAKDQSPALHVVNKINCAACKNSIGPVALRHYCAICKIYFCNPCHPRVNHEHQCYSNKNILPKLHNIRNIANLVASETRANLPIVEVIRKRRTSYAKEVSKRITKMLCKQFQADLEETFREHRETLAKAQKKINEIHSTKSNNVKLQSDSDVQDATSTALCTKEASQGSSEEVLAVTSGENQGKAEAQKTSEKEEFISDNVLNSVFENAIRSALTIAQKAILPDSESIVVRIEKGLITIDPPVDAEEEVPKVKEPATKGRRRNGKNKQPVVIEPIRTHKRELMDQVKVREAVKATQLLGSLRQSALRSQVTKTDNQLKTDPPVTAKDKNKGVFKKPESQGAKSENLKKSGQSRPVLASSIVEAANAARAILNDDSTVKDEAVETKMCLDPEIVAEVVMGVEPAVMRVKPRAPTPPPPTAVPEYQLKPKATASGVPQILGADSAKVKATKGKGVPGPKKKPGPKPGSTKRKRDTTKGAMAEDKATAPMPKKKRTAKTNQKNRVSTPILHEPTRMDLTALSAANVTGAKKVKNKNGSSNSIGLEHASNRDGEANVILAPERGREKEVTGMPERELQTQDEKQKKELSDKLLRLADIEDHKKSQEMHMRPATNMHSIGNGSTNAMTEEQGHTSRMQNNAMVDVDHSSADKNVGGQHMRNVSSQSTASRQDFANPMVAKRQGTAYNQQIAREKLIQQRHYLDQKELGARGMPHSNNDIVGDGVMENAGDVSIGKVNVDESARLGGRDSYKTNPYARTPQEQSGPGLPRARGEMDRMDRAEFDLGEEALRKQRVFDGDRENLVTRERYQQAQTLRSRQAEGMQLEQQERARIQQRERQMFEAGAARSLQRNESMRFGASHMGRSAADAEKSEYHSERARLAMQDEMELVERDPDGARGAKGMRGIALNGPPLPRGGPRDSREQGMRGMNEEYANANPSKVEQYCLQQEREREMSGQRGAPQPPTQHMEDRRRVLDGRASAGMGMDAPQGQGRHFQEGMPVQRQARGEGSNMLAARTSRDGLSANQRRLKGLQIELQNMDMRDPNRARMMAEFTNRKDFEEQQQQQQSRSTPQMQAQGAPEAVPRNAANLDIGNGPSYNARTPSQSRGGVARANPPSYALGRQGTTNGQNRAPGGWRGPPGHETVEDTSQHTMGRQQQQRQGRISAMSPNMSARMDIEHESIGNERMRDSIRGEGNAQYANVNGRAEGGGSMGVSERMGAPNERISGAQRPSDARGARGGPRGAEGIRGSYSNAYEPMMQAGVVNGGKGERVGPGGEAEDHIIRSNVNLSAARARAPVRQRPDGAQNYQQRAPQQQQQISLDQRNQPRQYSSIEREGMPQARPSKHGVAVQERWQGMGLQTGDRRPMNANYDPHELAQRDDRREISRDYR